MLASKLGLLLHEDQPSASSSVAIYLERRILGLTTSEALTQVEFLAGHVHVFMVDVAGVYT